MSKKKRGRPKAKPISVREIAEAVQDELPTTTIKIRDWGYTAGGAFVSSLATLGAGFLFAFGIRSAPSCANKASACLVDGILGTIVLGVAAVLWYWTIFDKEAYKKYRVYGRKLR